MHFGSQGGLSNGLLRDMNRLDCLDNNWGQLLSHGWMHFGSQGGLSNGLQHLSLVLVNQGDLYVLKHLQGLVLGHLKALGDYSGVESLRNVGVSLLQEFSDEKHS